MDKLEFQKIKVGDYVKIGNLKEVWKTPNANINEKMFKYSGLVGQVVRAGMDCLKLDIDNSEWIWQSQHLDRIATEDEYNNPQNKLPVPEFEISKYDTVEIKSREELDKTQYRFDPFCYDCAGKLLIVDWISPHRTGEEYCFRSTGFGFPCWAIKSVKPFREEDVETIPIDKENKVAEIEIRKKYDIGNKYSDIVLLKITSNIKKLLDNGNSLRFARIVAGKFVLVCKNEWRIRPSWNKHLAKAMEENNCSNYRLDFTAPDLIMSNIVDTTFAGVTIKDYEQPIIKIKVDFEKGTMRKLKVDMHNRCMICGSSLGNNPTSKFCHSCISDHTKRFDYHEYEEGYKVFENIDTNKTPVFGCEIERDYLKENHYEPYDDGERYDYINEYTEEDAMDELGIDYETYEKDSDYWQERIDDLVSTRRDERADEYDATHSDCGEDFDYDLDAATENVFNIMQGEELKKGILRWENVFMYDGSLNYGGIEWITSPHSFNWYVKNKDKIQTALDELEYYGFVATGSAGNHIHINKDYFVRNGIDYGDYCASKIAILFNTYWKQFKKIANRERENYTQKPAQNQKDTPETIVTKTQSQKRDHSVAVNLQHSASIEIRLWAAIRSADELLFFLDNMQALAKYVKFNSLEKIQVSKMSEYMKGYKLPTSLNIAKERLETLSDDTSKQIVKEIDKLIKIREKEGKK